MLFKIDNKDFFLFNWKYEKLIQNKEGKPNQKELCYFESATIFDFEITDTFKDLVTFDYNHNGYSELQYKDRKFFGELPKINDNCDLKSANANFNIKIRFNAKNFFKKFYSNETINLYIKSIQNNPNIQIDLQNVLQKINLLPKGKFTFKLIFDEITFPIAKGFLTNYIPNEIEHSFTIKVGYEIFDINIKKILDKLVCKNHYKLTKHNYLWKYKIDVQNFKWLINCKNYKCKNFRYCYDENDDNGSYKYYYKNDIKNVFWELFYNDFYFEFSSKKEWKYVIIKNYSLENPFEKNPQKVCKEPKEYKGIKFVLDEELPVNTKYDKVFSKKVNKT